MSAPPRKDCLNFKDLDLVNDLTELEVERNFAVLLDLYGKMRLSSQWSYSSFEPMVKVANLKFLMGLFVKINTMSATPLILRGFDFPFLAIV